MLEKNLTQKILNDFTESLKKEKIQILHDLLIDYGSRKLAKAYCEYPQSFWNDLGYLWNLKKPIAPSSPKCTVQDQQSRIDSGELEESLGGGLHETYAKDKFPHPNKKY